MTLSRSFGDPPTNTRSSFLPCTLRLQRYLFTCQIFSRSDPVSQVVEDFRRLPERYKPEPGVREEARRLLWLSAVELLEPKRCAFFLDRFLTLL
jgi:hypothetical protein